MFILYINFSIYGMKEDDFVDIEELEEEKTSVESSADSTDKMSDFLEK